jgi:hypothetical protein
MFAAVQYFEKISQMEDNNVPAESHKRKRGLPSVPEPILTEGDLQMKQLVQRQLNTDITLQGYDFFL